MKPLDNLISYIKDITGSIPVVEPIPMAALAKLPLYLSNLFDIRRLYLFGQPLLIAFADTQEKLDLAQLARQRETLAEKLEASIVLVLPQIKSYERKRLIQKQVPFIVPGRQLYLPMLLTDLRESFPAPVRVQAKPMSWVAQVIVMRHIIRNDIKAMPLNRIAEELGYTPMAISQGVNELATLRVCARLPVGREKWIQFDSSTKAIWQAASPHMRCPVKKSLLAGKLDSGNTHLLRAGMTALQDRTNMVSSEKDSFALSKLEIDAALHEGWLETCMLEEEAVALVQAWAYDPKLLASGSAVDPLSLYLCFRNDPDERVQLVLEQLLQVLN